MWTNSKSLFLSKILVKVVFVMLICAAFVIPICVRWYDAVSDKGSVFVPLCATLYSSFPFAVITVIALNTLLNNISKQQVFIDRNVTCLRIISWCCFAAAIIFAIFAYWRSISLIITFAAAFLGLILRVLKNVLAEAVELRQENDYTI